MFRRLFGRPSPCEGAQGCIGILIQNPTPAMEGGIYIVKSQAWVAAFKVAHVFHFPDVAAERGAVLRVSDMNGRELATRTEPGMYIVDYYRNVEPLIKVPPIARDVIACATPFAQLTFAVPCPSLTPGGLADSQDVLAQARLEKLTPFQSTYEDGYEEIVISSQ